MIFDVKHFLRETCFTYLCKRHLAVLPRTVHLCLQHQSFDLPQMFLAGVCAKGHERYVRKAMGSMLERRWVLIASSKKLATPIFKKFHNINNDLLRAQICVIRLWSEFEFIYSYNFFWAPSSINFAFPFPLQKKNNQVINDNAHRAQVCMISLGANLGLYPYGVSLT